MTPEYVRCSWWCAVLPCNPFYDLHPKQLDPKSEGGREKCLPQRHLLTWCCSCPNELIPMPESISGVKELSGPCVVTRVWYALAGAGWLSARTDALPPVLFQKALKAPCRSFSRHSLLAGNISTYSLSQILWKILCSSGISSASPLGCLFVCRHA